VTHAVARADAKSARVRDASVIQALDLSMPTNPRVHSAERRVFVASVEVQDRSRFLVKSSLASIHSATRHGTKPAKRMLFALYLPIASLVNRRKP
jgi:hypothetical protein